MKPLVDGLAPGKLFPKSIATLIGFDDDEYLLYAIQVGRPPVALIASTGDAQGRYLVKPERVTVAFPFHQDHEASLARFLKEP